MPHIVVKLHAGRSDAKKAEIADALTKALMAADGCSEAAVSVALVDVRPEDWTETVYRTEIEPQLDQLQKKPGYRR